MAGVRFTAVPSRPTEFLDFTSMTLEELQHLVPPFETAFHAPMAAWRLDGKPRTARQCTVYKHCPLPTPEDRLFFILTSLKTSARKTLRLPRCLRRGGMRAFGGGLHAPCQRQVVGVQWRDGPATYTPCRLRYPVPLRLVAQVPARRVTRREPTAGPGTLRRYGGAV
jgi:hypothetical protein